MRSSSEHGSSRPRPEAVARHAAAAVALPLYQSLGDANEIQPHTADRLRVFCTELGDPFGGRRNPSSPSDVLVQTASDLPLYWSFSRHDLRSMADVTAAVWRHLGVRPGSGVAFYDFATSPTVLFGSRSFISFLEAGAADQLGCLPICNDGLPELADRCVHVLEYMRPETLFVDTGLMGPLIRALTEHPISHRPSRVVVAGDEDPADRDRLDSWSASLGCEVIPLLRVDAGLLLAPPCATDPAAFHPDPASYVVEAWNGGHSDVETAVGRLVVTNLALESTVVHRYAPALWGLVSDGPCACGRSGLKVVIDDGR